MASRRATLSLGAVAYVQVKFFRQICRFDCVKVQPNAKLAIG